MKSIGQFRSLSPVFCVWTQHCRQYRGDVVLSVLNEAASGKGRNMGIGTFVRLYQVPKLKFPSISQAVLWGPEQIKEMDMLYQHFRSSVFKRWLKDILKTLVIPLVLATYRTMPLRAEKREVLVAGSDKAFCGCSWGSMLSTTTHIWISPTGNPHGSWKDERACSLPASPGHEDAAPVTRMIGSDRNELHITLSFFVDPCMPWL